MSSKSKRPDVIIVNRCFIKGEYEHLLIIRRSSRDPHNPDHWEAPGGKVDKGQDLFTSLKREVAEETRLFIESVRRIVYVEDYIIQDGLYEGFLYVIHFYITLFIDGEVSLSNEHSEYAWVTYDEMMSYKLTNETRAAAIELKKYL